MTHKDIYTKFMIEYDKANVTSSYPSLTEYEVATVLDKAYNALIAQKVTGNNVRRAPFEADTKAVSDLQPLIHREHKAVVKVSDSNILKSYVPDLFLYFVNARLEWDNSYTENNQTKAKASDDIKYRAIPVKLVSHDMAEKFIASSSNVPWVKTPVCYIEGDLIYIVYDPFKSPSVTKGILIVYIKKPKTFVSNLMFTDNDEFECSDTMAEELISLAITFALENVESQRLTSKLNMRGLEA